MGILILLLLSFTTLHAKWVDRPETAWEEPWGTDCHLNQKATQKATSRSLPTSLIRFHQTVISPVQGPRSHFYPTSSQYTLLAMRQHGFLRGYLMGCSRLTRENTDPWVYRKIDIGHSTRKQDMPGIGPTLALGLWSDPK
jgi:uncharacterized protein